MSRDACSIESQKGGNKLFLLIVCEWLYEVSIMVLSAKYSGRMRSLVVNWDAKERSSTCQEPTSSIPHGTISAAKMLPTNVV